jgi:hypothetical protein
MATNASTWFYNEPEHNAYLLEERVNHTFWSNRLSAVYLDCLSDTPPFKMTGTWHELSITIEWVPRDYFILTTQPDAQVDSLIIALKEILGFNPTISYVDPGGSQIVEWHMKQAEQRIQNIQGDPNYHHIKRYK